jgi:hypothetical protein
VFADGSWRSELGQSQPKHKRVAVRVIDYRLDDAGRKGEPEGYRLIPTNVPSGWQKPSVASLPSSRPRLSPTSVLEIPTTRAARRHDSPSRMTAATASRRTSRASGGLPPQPGRAG